MTTILSRRSYRWLLGVLLVLIGIVLNRLPADAQTAEGPVYVIQVRGAIDLGLAPYTARVLRAAEAARARAVILEIDTPGGRLDAVLQMRDAILDSPLRTIAFVDRTAFSAGALVAIAAQEIYLTPGAVLGAATPVDGSGEAAEAKVISAVRSTFRATAELRGRDPRIAEAMVDPDVEIAGLVRRGQLLTLTTSDAQRVGYATGVALDRAALLSSAGLEDATVVETAPGVAERLVRFLTSPLVASLLISLGVLLVLVDLFTAGFGVAGLVGLSLLAVFFWGHSLAGLAGWEGVVLVALGLALIGLELFVIPGFGVAGVLGLLALLGGLFISLLGDQIVTREALVRAGFTVGLAVISIASGAAALLWLLPQLPGLRGLVLQTNVALPHPGSGRGSLMLAGVLGPTETRLDYTPAPRLRAGVTGVALSDLRPAGYARIDGVRMDVVTRGDYIAAGSPIEVIADQGYRRVVRQVQVTERDAGTPDADVSGVREAARLTGEGN